MTVLYGDLFDHPVTADEIHRYLSTVGSREAVSAALDDLKPGYLNERDGLVCLRGRESLIALRQRRQQMAAERWPRALRFGGWLSRVPFLRMVAVCGSQAMENGDRDGDIDLFLITTPERLWLVQSVAMTLRRAGHWMGVELCPNYLLTTRSLQLSERNLYTAREAAQVMPLWGKEAFEAFHAANSWVASFLPQRDLTDRCRWLEAQPRHRTTAWLEWLLGGVLGDVLDRVIHRLLLVYYRLRLRHNGWDREQIERCYQRDRQTVVTGGFAAAVARRFVDRGAEALAGAVSRADLERCFFGTVDSTAELEEPPAEPDPLYAGLLATRYGSGR